MVHPQRASPLALLHQEMPLVEVQLQRAVVQVLLHPLLLQLQLLVQPPALHRAVPLVLATDAV